MPDLTSTAGSNVNSPSKIPAPRSRGSRSIFSGETALAPISGTASPADVNGVVGQKRAQPDRSPPRQPSTRMTAAAQAAQSSTTNASIRTYRANATTTARPPVTKTGTSNVRAKTTVRPKESPSLFNEALIEVDQMAKKRPAWDTRVPIIKMSPYTKCVWL